MIKYTLIIIITFLLFVSINATEIRSLWVMPWNITNEAQIDELVLDAVHNNQTEILAEVRYRADALYTPNKINYTFNNPEPRSNILKNNDFDPLEYLLQQAHLNGLQVQAWISALNVISPNGNSLRNNYIYREHPDWIMVDSYGNLMNGKSYMGYFVDPGIPEVKNHLLNVILDIVANYPTLDGIHLDYIRYPAQKIGYSKVSVSRYNSELQSTNMSWNEWRIKQITELISNLRERARLINPNLLITAAVFADLQEARIHYAQDWPAWLKSGIIDRAYPMAYVKKYTNFYRIINEIANDAPKDSIVVGLRAWQENPPYVDYPVGQIIEKAKLSRQMGFAGIALFSYEGVKKTGMFPALAAGLYEWQENELPETDEEKFIT